MLVLLSPEGHSIWAGAVLQAVPFQSAWKTDCTDSPDFTELFLKFSLIKEKSACKAETFWEVGVKIIGLVIFILYVEAERIRSGSFKFASS